MAKDKSATILVTDLLGRTLWYYEVKEGERTIAWTPVDIRPGTYLYLIRSNDGQTQEGKLLFIK